MLNKFKPALLGCVLSCLLLASLPVGASTPELPVRNEMSPMGMNIGGLVDWSTALPFIDVFRLARPFKGTNPDLEVDEQGWVKKLNRGQEAQTFMLWDINNAFPSGNYTVLYEGEGKLEYGGGARLVGREDGRDSIYVKSAQGGIHLKIKKIKESNPLRNIRVIMPGGICASQPLKRVVSDSACSQGDYMAFADHYDSLVFNPDYLNLLADFKVLRFLDYMGTNDSPLVSWEDRTRIDAATWAGKMGGPVEMMVELSNRLKADPWLTIPHQASDDYVRQLAEHFKANLRSDAKIYVEYSNEVWNGRFKQFGYMLEQGEALKLGGDRYEAGRRYYSKRAVEIFKIWESVMGGSDRLVRVMAGQAANSFIVQSELSFEDAYKHVDAIAIAPYFGDSLGNPDFQTEKLNVNELFAKIRRESLLRSIDWMEQHGKLAKKYKIDLIAYEGGQHLAGYNGKENDKKLNKLFDKANTNPQMRSAYERYFAAWKKAGGKTFVYYKDTSRNSKWGRWGITETLNVPRKKAPKLDAVLTFIENNPRWW